MPPYAAPMNTASPPPPLRGNLEPDPRVESEGTFLYTLLTMFGCTCDNNPGPQEDFSVKGSTLPARYAEAVEQGKLLLWKCHNGEVQTFYGLQREVQATKSQAKQEEMVRFVHKLQAKYPRKSKNPHRRITLAPRAPSISRAEPELLSEFLKEAADGKALVNKMTMDEKLVSYGLYKQGCDGDNVLPSPGVFDVAARMKWGAWMKYRGLSEDAAMRQLVAFTRQMKRKYQR